jgi:hypothetical protein
MARLRRRWRILKWAGLVLLLLIWVAWAASRWWNLSYSREYGPMRPAGQEGRVVWYARAATQVGLSGGCLRVSRGASSIRKGQWLLVRWPVPGWDWRVYSYQGFGYWNFRLPLWIPFLLFVIPTPFLWWRDRRLPPGHCQKCGYNLTGNLSGVCPECGESI